jgi:hypothetical protein
MKVIRVVVAVQLHTMLQQREKHVLFSEAVLVMLSTGIEGSEM